MESNVFNSPLIDKFIPLTINVKIILGSPIPVKANVGVPIKDICAAIALEDSDFPYVNFDNCWRVAHDKILIKNNDGDVYAVWRLALLEPDIIKLLFLQAGWILPIIEWMPQHDNNIG